MQHLCAVLHYVQLASLFDRHKTCICAAEWPDNQLYVSKSCLSLVCFCAALFYSGESAPVSIPCSTSGAEGPLGAGEVESAKKLLLRVPYSLHNNFAELQVGPHQLPISVSYLIKLIDF